MSLLLATLFIVDLPLGPGSEALARQLVAPYTHAEVIDDGPWHLWDIRVQPKALHYTVSLPHQPPAITVHVNLEAAARDASDAITTTLHPGAPPDAQQASNAIAKALRARLMSDMVQFRQRPPPAQDHPVDVPADGKETLERAATTMESPPAGTPRWLAALLLLALASSIATYRATIAHEVRQHAGRGWVLAGGVALALGATLFAMDDVVLHPNAHGWDTVRSVVGFNQTPFPLWDRYGTFVIELGRLLGLGAEPGRETFVAARLAATVSVIVMYALGLALFRSRSGALVAAGAFATSPAILFVGRGEALSAPGVLLMLLAAWLLALAARRRHLGLLISGGIALACLANFRLMGPVMAPAVGLLALLPHDAELPSRPPGTWVRWAILTWFGAALVASPHLWRMLWMMTAELGVRPEATTIPRTLIDSPMWTPFALLALAVTGLMSLAHRRRWLALSLSLWALCAVLAPASSSAFYQDQARYQVYVVPALALCSAAALVLLWRQRRAVAVTVTLGWFVCFAWGQELAGEALATDQAEVSQLRAWRALSQDLPKGAWLAVPVATNGRARTALPDVELLHARPDVRLVNLDEARQAAGAPLYWFEGLSCAAHYPSDPPEAARDCIAAREQATLSPARLMAVDAELPADLAARIASPGQSLTPWGGDPTQWNPRPFTSAPVTIGLYRMHLAD
ncbi:MAG: glycosyltransferase family 39 protein [Myxococcota bacterium]